jgi:hypothetical protein
VQQFSTHAERLIADAAVRVHAYRRDNDSEGGFGMSPALQAIIVFAASVALVVGLLVAIVVQIFEEHEINVERRRLPVSHH